MSRAVMQKIVGFAGAAMLASAPASAQFKSDGYKFLEAVDDREGDAVTQLLNEPGNTLINTRDKVSGETGLHIVTKRRDIQWIKFLMQRGANPNIRDKNGITPLQLAVRLNYVEGAQELIKRGARFDISNGTGETPLITAVHARNTQLVRILLAQGANPDRTDNSGRSAREYAQLLPSNSIIMNEFESADAARKSKGDAKNYGPSF